MFYINCVYTAETRKDLEGWLQELREDGIVDACRADEGCLRYEFYFSAEREAELLLVEQWDTREHQEIHDVKPHAVSMGEKKVKYGVQTEVRILE